MFVSFSDALSFVRVVFYSLRFPDRRTKTLLSEKLQEMDAEGPPERLTPVMVALHDCDPGADATDLEVNVLYLSCLDIVKLLLRH